MTNFTKPEPAPYAEDANTMPSAKKGVEMLIPKPFATRLYCQRNLPSDARTPANPR